MAPLMWEANTRPGKYGNGLGTVFKLSWASSGGGLGGNCSSQLRIESTDGAEPQGGLYLDGLGNIFGTTAGDANGGSVVFEITP